MTELKRGNIVKMKDKGFGIVTSNGNTERAAVFRFEVKNEKVIMNIPADGRPKSFSVKNLILDSPDNWDIIDKSQLKLYVNGIEF